MGKEPVINIEFHDVVIMTNPEVEQDYGGDRFVLSMGAVIPNSTGEFSAVVIKAVGALARPLLHHVVKGTIVNVRGHFTKRGLITKFMYGVGYTKPGMYITTTA